MPGSSLQSYLAPPSAPIHRFWCEQGPLSCSAYPPRSATFLDQNTAVTYVYMRALCDRCKACRVSMQRRVKRALLEQACDFFVFGRRSMHAQHHFVISSALNQVLSSNALPTTASPFFHAHTIALKHVVLYIFRQIRLRIVNPIRLLYNHQHAVL